MKRNWLILAISLLWTMSAHALIVTVNGHGDIESEGMAITLDEATEDILSGKVQMELSGTLLADGPLTVTITRSATGLDDELCCGDKCQAGNQELSETRQYAATDDIVTWFIHYAPQPSSDETITYLFDDGVDQLSLTVRFVYAAQGVEEVNFQPAERNRKVLQNGIIYIIQGDKIYHL